MRKEELISTLVQHLGWEPDMVSSIVDTIHKAAVKNAKAELEEIIEVRNFVCKCAACGHRGGLMVAAAHTSLPDISRPPADTAPPLSGYGV